MFEQMVQYLDTVDCELSELVDLSDHCDIIEHKFIILDSLTKVMVNICEEVQCGNSTSVQVVELSRVMVWLEDLV